jgi:D-3-phosphoglycerate dehydrogenase / 2-oxoglutarate reductase
VGGSTFEAQARIATDLCRDVVAVLRGHPPSAAVNAPVAAAPEVRPFVRLAHTLGRAFAQIADEPVLPSLALVLEGELRSDDGRPFLAAFLMGLLQNVTDRRVSQVNAEAVARELGIAVEVLGAQCDRGFSRAVSVRGGKTALAGTVVHGQQLRLVEVDGFEVDVMPEGHLIMTRHADVPGVVGKAGTLLGEAAINISNMQVARSERGGEALMLLGIDRAAPSGVLAQLRGIGGMRLARSIEL